MNTEKDMCEKQKRIEELELEISQIRRNYAEAAKFNAEERHLDSQIVWRPWQVALIPILLGILALVAAIAR
ncbi:hypothetical protein VII00023_06212 [Vibrio ichthyoenteri ATCC 700023]|uniref:Uncharacterized protein n=1 Tax=Vibrio ichthyoenteri ATCC 700023 TaxID=870968 RepID=F9S1W1_9VIBR|nr:hypothetical protein [Vibrio ichthyoenteri]EGU41201.1 hypothetical protein VII00023_06212 [Vibrio ichthyoenteri ATCC 700023]